MAKFLLVKFSFMVEITDADALRDAALKKFDAADMTTDDYPDTADWHASEEGQEERRQVATQDVDALTQCVGMGMAEARRLLEVIDGVPGVKAVPRARPWAHCRAPRRTRSATPGRNARGLHGGPRPATPKWPASTARGLHSGLARSRLIDAKHPEITTALCTAPRPSRPATLARVRTLARMRRCARMRACDPTTDVRRTKHQAQCTKHKCCRI